MRVLVTGASGFIGSHVVRHLLTEGHEVHALVRTDKTPPSLTSAAGEIAIAPCDLLDPDLEDTIKRIDPQGCIHLAWFVQPGRYRTDVAQNLASLDGSIRLLSTLGRTNCRRIVLGGTCLEASVHAAGGGGVYPAAKAALHLVADNIDTQNLSAVCAHIFYVYGPHEHPDRLVPTIIRRLLRGEEVRVLPPREKRDYLYVKDVASALCALLDHETSGGVDICAGTDIELGDLFRTIEEITGREGLIIEGGHEGRTERVPRGDVTRIRSTGWRPRFSLRQGIQESVEWWERQPIR